jgi:uroporphyrinogen-III synthase
MDKSVLLVKAFSEDGEEDKYVKALKNAGACQVHIVPALQFVFKGEEKLLTALANGVGNSEGIILTSPRAAECVLRAINAVDDSQVEAVNYWKEKKLCYVVGEATFEWATNKLGFK